MKTIDQLSVPKLTNSDFPHGSILNETDVSDGTPVVREIYNDILVNHYKLLGLAGITPNGSEDSETNGYQIIEALKRFPNVLNDIEQILDLSGTVWSLDLKFSLLPNKFIVFAKATDNYNSAISYTIKGSESTPEYSFSSEGFRLGDTLLIVLDNSGVKAYSVTAIFESRIDVPTPLGVPLAFNDTKPVHYFEDGCLITERPRVYYIQANIALAESDSSILVLNAFIIKGKLLCFCFSQTDGEYFFYQYDMLSLTSGTRITYSIDDSNDYQPYCYTDGTYVYLTNDANTSANDYVLRKLNYNESTGVITNNASITLNDTFEKTTNVVMKSTALITFVNGVLKSYALGSPTATELGIYNTISGNIFVLNNEIHFGNGIIAMKWTI